MAYRAPVVVRIIALPVFAAALGGCYSYSRVPVELALPGEQIRLTVTRDGALDYVTFVETNEAAPSFVGTLEGEDRGSLLVRVPVPGDPTQGPAARRIDQIVRVPVDEVLAVERRTLSGVKTGAMIAASVAVGTALVLGIIDASGDADPDDGEPPDLQILRIPIG